jgi:hypothetical protein
VGAVIAAQSVVFEVVGGTCGSLLTPGIVAAVRSSWSRRSWRARDANSIFFRAGQDFLDVFFKNWVTDAF